MTTKRALYSGQDLRYLQGLRQQQQPVTNNKDSQGHELLETEDHMGQFIFRQHGADVSIQFTLVMSVTGHPRVYESAKNGCYQMFGRLQEEK